MFPIFNHMSEQDIQKALDCSGAREQLFKKNQLIFKEGDTAKYLYILKSGKVAICKDSISGNRMIMNQFHEKGVSFGEVYLFLEDVTYDFYAIAMEDSQILQIPKNFFYHTCSNNCCSHEQLIKNMLSILAGKAFILNRKLQIVATGSIRQKICRWMMQNINEHGVVENKLTREEMADYLGVPRPSLSRELMAMQNEGLIEVERKRFIVHNIEMMEEII